eukprot:6145915-Pyramimonas_sp.AAC.1
MPPLSIADLRQAAQGFSGRTALGPDQFRPRHWALASNGALAVLGYLLHLCEVFGAWPTIIRRVHIALLGKPTGRYRPIALLPSIYCVWAHARLSWVRAWSPRLGRPYLALGPQRSTTDVAARVM